MQKLLLLLGLAAGLAGCVSTQEIPLSMNTYQLEVSGTGRFGAGAVPQATLRRAAELTLEKGFTHFILGGATMQTAHTYAGQASVVPIIATTRSNSVTVRMYRPGENANALDARTILDTYGK
ncbi:hypothetical protein [Chelativorans sp.]|uniref:hypothetical protein n=1 Tax=Chelativorans sp. TaxID=2203393 RepID=UPI002811A41B|nr:hypothetical protein [Chelativorans sp.]